ncbi:hypothetical protein F2Q70_00002297 [Brassica cretica]|uniref:Uncharacterized protein n=1 Tax=Brassica cretica TaxID=69181 RepID=A0A8S9IUB9_BRACR|nr:hypothetical protein F2Q68_00020297 [Brassica cretica]KAF2572666.1 hypothetical protein F2Q70_00002297 [Brassica cretica]
MVADLLGPDMKTSRPLTQEGLISVAQGCHELELIEVYILTVKNEALQIMGENLKNLNDFRMTLHYTRGCPKLQKLEMRWSNFCLHLGSNQVPDKPDESVEPELLAYYSLVDERPHFPDSVV